MNEENHTNAMQNESRWTDAPNMLGPILGVFSTGSEGLGVEVSETIRGSHTPRYRVTVGNMFGSESIDIPKEPHGIRNVFSLITDIDEGKRRIDPADYNGTKVPE